MKIRFRRVMNLGYTVIHSLDKAGPMGSSSMIVRGTEYKSFSEHMIFNDSPKPASFFSLFYSSSSRVPRKPSNIQKSVILIPPKFAGLYTRINSTIEILEALPSTCTDGKENAEVVMKTGSGEQRFTAKDYVLKAAIPNFFFHVVTAYDILRYVLIFLFITEGDPLMLNIELNIEKPSEDLKPGVLFDCYIYIG